MSGNIINQMLLLFGLMGVGFIINKGGVIDDTANKRFSAFLLKVSLPATILNSAIKQPEIANSTVLYVTMIAVGVFILMPLMSKLCAVLFRLEPTYQLMLNYSNLGFMGFPIIASLYGEESIFYAAIFMMVFNIHIFTVGVMTLQGKIDSARSLIKKLCNPGIFSAILAFIIVICRVPVPNVAGDLVNSLGSVTTPLAMVVIGSQLAQVELMEILRSYKLYLMSFFKLLVYPAVVYLLLMLMIGPGIEVRVATILVGLPVAGNVTMLSSEYGGNVALAAQGTCISTILSILTIPVMLALLS